MDLWKKVKMRIFLVFIALSKKKKKKKTINQDKVNFYIYLILCFLLIICNGIENIWRQCKRKLK